MAMPRSLGMSSISHGVAVRRRPGLTAGPVIGVVGALVLIAGLSRPFYMLLPASSTSAGSSSRFTERLIDLLLGSGGSAAHGAPLDAWTAFGYLDVVLAGGAALAALALVTALAVPALGGVGRVVWLFGIAAATVVAYRLVHHPLPDEGLSVGNGAWIVLAGALATALGGRLTTWSD